MSEMAHGKGEYTQGPKVRIVILQIASGLARESYLIATTILFYEGI